MTSSRRTFSWWQVPSSCYCSLVFAGANIDSQDCTSTTQLTGPASDNSGYTLTLTRQGSGFSSAVTDKYGTTYTPGLTTDTNQNQLTGPISPQFYGSYKDSSGNTTLTSTRVSATTQTYSYAGQGSNVTYTFQVNRASFTVQSNFGCPLVQESSQTLDLATSITLPDGSSYTLTYEPTPGVTQPDPNNPTIVTGRVASITLPTGASISYNYNGPHHGISCEDGGVSGFTRTTSDGPTTYSRSYSTTTNVWTTTVTDPMGNQSVYNFSGAILPGSIRAAQFETQRLVYQLVNGSQSLVKTLVTCYDANFSSCATPQRVLVWTRKDVYSYPKGVSQPSLSEVFVSNGLPTQDNQFDFGVNTGSAPTASPLRATKFTYTSLNRPACVQVTAGPSPATCGTVTSSTNALTNYLNYDSHGNVGTVQRWVSGGTYLSSNFSYYQTGLTKTVTDVNGASTGYTYADCNNSFLTGVSEPLGLTRSMSWDCNGEVHDSVTDENSKITTYNFTDPFWRMVSVTDPTSAALNMYYNFFLAGNGNAFIDSYMLLNGGSAETDTVKYVDTLGRVAEVQHRQAPLTDIYDTVAYTYDGKGRQNGISIPCVASGDEGATCSSATTTQTYDAVDRPLLETNGGGGTVSNTYTGRDVLSVVSSPSTSRQYEYDGLGRLISVCEISTSLPGVAPCKQDTAQTGYWTRYQYDALDHLIGVCQNTIQAYSVDCVASPSAGQQTRKFTYDGLGRMTSESDPESSLKQYFYDSAPSSPGVACPGPYNGDLIKVYDANGNTTCFSYDALHRKLSTTYSGPNSNGLNRYFVYDSATVNGTVMQNTMGRLAEAYTATTQAGTKTTDEGFSYSARGDLTDIYESTLHSGGYYHTTASYFEHGVVKTLAGIPGQTSFTYGVDSEGRQVSAKQGSTNLVTGTTFNAASQPLTVTLGQGDTDTYVYYPTTGLMKSYTFTVGATPKSMAGTLTWNTNGSLSSLAITDSFNAGGAQTCKYGDPVNNIPGYDDLGRLVKVDCGANLWQQNFSYDAFGNLTKAVPTGGTGIAWNPGYNPANNHYTLAGTSYDANGNVRTDTFHAYSWDGDGHVATIDSSTCGSNGTCLTYDALGRMVEKNVSGTYTEILYSPVGKLAVMNGQTLVTAYVPLPGGATYNVAPGYARLWHKDWLGTVRLSTTLNNRSVDYDRSFAPFGETYQNFGSATNYDFTGDTQDTIAGTYDATNREMNPTQGRWLSPDPTGGHNEEPQTLNRYAYVKNDPLRLSDYTGLDFYLACTQTLENASSCQGGHVGTTDDQGNFTATVITSDSLRDPNSGNTATVNASGVQITTSQGTFAGQYFENPNSIEPENINGETVFVDHNPITLSGSGPVSGFSFFVNDNCGGTCLASGSFTYSGGTPDETRNLLDQHGAFRSIVDRTIPLLGMSPDEIQFHPGTTQHRFGEGPSLHISVPRDPRDTVPTSGPFHVDKDAPGLRHFACAELGAGCQ